MAESISIPSVSSSAGSSSIPERLKYKNRLQEITQKEGLPLPLYHTINEGLPHHPKFRSTVQVFGKEYTTVETFLHRKEAEQQAAKCALDFIAEKTRSGDELRECFLILEETKLYKLILNEYAVKVHSGRAVCKTEPVIEDGIPGFKSSVIFDGIYNGDIARNKKEAEQSAYRCAILSLMGNAESQSNICGIIKSRRKIHAALHTSVSQNAQLSSLPVAVSDIPSTPVPLADSTVLPPHHEFTRTKTEPSCQRIDLPITFVPPDSLQLPMDGAEGSSRKRRKNEMNTSKKLRADALNLDLNRDDSVPLNPVGMPTSVSS